MSAGDRGVIVTDHHLAAETWSAIIDHTPVIHDLLWDARNKRPHDLWALIYDDPVAGDLLYPPLQLFKVDGDEAGLILGGLGSLWVLGSNGIGPMITDREYVSGANKLSNPTFDEGGLYWRRPSEGSLWVFGVGVATNAGGLRTDDVLEYDLPFPTRPGYAYQAVSIETFGIGTMRIRTIYAGRFNPPNLLTSWLTVDALTIGPIAKPQLLNFAAGPTTLGSSMAFSGGTLTAGPNPRPTYIDDPGFETGTGWTDITTPPPMSDDIDLVNAPAEAASGSWVMRVGPVTQHQLLQNATFNTDLANWYMSSNVAEPDPGLFYWFATDGVDGTGGATTAGTVTPVPLTINDQSEFQSWLASQPSQWEFGFGVKNGTPYPTFEANSLGDPNRGAPGYIQDFDGSWILDSTSPTSVALAVTNRASFDSWVASQPNGTPYATFEANDLADPNRGATGYIQDFDGSWVQDYRSTKYLRADSSSGTGGVQAYDVTPGEQYEVEAQVRRSPAADGFAYISAHIPHPTVANREQWFTSESAKSQELPGETFERLGFTLNIPANRFKLDLLFEVHEHSAEYWTVDNYLATRTRGNRAEIQSDTTTTVVPGTRYQGDVLMRSGGDMQVGNVRVGFILTGAGVEPRRVNVDQGSTDYDWTSIPIDFTPDPGYTEARRFVAGMDIVGDPAWIDSFQVTRMNNNSDTSTWASVPVVADQRYLLQVAAEVLGATEGSLTVGVVLTGPAVDPEYVPLNFDAKDNAGVNSQSTEVRPPPGYNAATLYVQSTDISGGTGIRVYTATLTKMDNNTAETAGTAIAVTPERTYKWSQIARSGVNLERGTVTLAATCKRAGHDDIVFPSSAMEATEGARKVLEFSFTPPSGYDEIDVSAIGTDIEGDSWTLGAGELRDTDTGTVVFDTKVTNPGGASPAVNSTAPDGAEEVRLAIVIEEGSTTWTAGGAALLRTGVTPATGNAIIPELLTDPVTGLPLGIAAGTISCPEVIPHDWVITNLADRDALEHYCKVLSDPPREFKLNPAIPPTIDVGTAADVFEVHDPADALLPEDQDVQEMSVPESDVSDRPTEVTVLGAELGTVSGRPVLITATAQVPGDVRLDINNRAITRTKQISSGTVDHAGYAEAFAGDEAAREASPPVFLTAKLSGRNTRADAPPGDTIYAFHRAAGVFDPDVTTTIEGETVNPRAVRVFIRERTHGPSHHIEFLKPDGTRLQFRQPDGTTGPKLPGVRWSDEDATVLSVGDRMPEWKSDPQGKSEGEQYLRDRASRPR